MDLEAIQLLNLSPIPELSEVELSTMLDHLSGLSDVNGDLTDRNVEDILKEAEDLLDKSFSSKIQESRDINNSPTTEENKKIDTEDEMDSNDSKEDFQDLDLSESKHCNTPVKSDHTLPETFSNETDAKQNFSSSFELTSTNNFSPESSSNHIRSTIDSLKEFSTLIEKKLVNQSPNSSQTHSKKVKEDKKVITVGNKLKENLVSVKPVFNNSRSGKSNFPTKKNIPDPMAKSLKMLNCFERLYQVQPVRLTGDKKAKPTQKSPKTIVKKKLTKSLKNTKKSVWPEKKVLQQIDAKISPHISYSVLQTDLHDDDSIKQNLKSLKYSYSNNSNFTEYTVNENVSEDGLMKNNFVECNFPNDGLKIIQSRVHEKPTLKVIQGSEKVKDLSGKVNAVSGSFNKGNMKLNVGEIDKAFSTLESEDENFFLKSDKSLGIRRLEEQFSNLKEKYEYQMAKLEAENSRLKEAINCQQRELPVQVIKNSEIAIVADVEHPVEAKSSKTLVLSSPSSCATENKTLISASLENCKVPKNSPCSTLENVQSATTVKEAFSQTEKELKNTSIQCCQEYKETGTNAEIVLEAKRVENKENVGLTKKVGKSKPFSDVNIHQMLKKKKIFNHESQLLATLRGLQAELNLKEKENRKLKIEIDSLRKQTKKPINNKTESCKKCHIGTQTIGLVSFSQRPYNPENYEVPQEFETENEELRFKIRALEEDFELLKEKRINDLQSLHQVHEEEMAKLVSKLETQSALTRHLHSLLINR